jgi:hypothetical protein
MGAEDVDICDHEASSISSDVANTPQGSFGVQSNVYIWQQHHICGCAPFSMAFMQCN